MGILGKIFGGFLDSSHTVTSRVETSHKLVIDGLQHLAKAAEYYFHSVPHFVTIASTLLSAVTVCSSALVSVFGIVQMIVWSFMKNLIKLAHVLRGITALLLVTVWFIFALYYVPKLPCVSFKCITSYMAQILVQPAGVLLLLLPPVIVLARFHESGFKENVVESIISITSGLLTFAMSVVLLAENKRYLILWIPVGSLCVAATTERGRKWMLLQIKQLRNRRDFTVIFIVILLFSVSCLVEHKYSVRAQQQSLLVFVRCIGLLVASFVWDAYFSRYTPPVSGGELFFPLLHVVVFSPKLIETKILFSVLRCYSSFFVVPHRIVARSVLIVVVLFLFIYFLFYDMSNITHLRKNMEYFMWYFFGNVGTHLTSTYIQVRYNKHYFIFMLFISALFAVVL